MQIVTDIRPGLEEDEVYRLLGYGQTANVSSQISRKIQQSIMSARSILKPIIAYREKKIRETGKSTVIFFDNLVFHSARLATALKRCDRITVFLATVGKDMDNTISRLIKQNRITDAFIYDAIGSVAVEKTVEAFHDNYESVSLSDGEATTLRFSPGYCDWPVQEQKKIFRLLDNTQIDVELNSSCLMTPRKSVSGVFGIGSNGFITRRNSNPCRFCDMDRCLVRRSA